MSLLELSSILWGSAEIIERDPNIDVIRGCVYLPYKSGEAWGVFDESSGQAIHCATDYREDVHLSHDQLTQTDASFQGITVTAPEGTYIYGGYISIHYGHFVINTLPRFWAIARLKTPSTKILYHGAGQPEEYFRFPFIASIMGALGLTPTDFVAFSVPTRVNCLVIPHTSFREQQAAHKCYSTFCRIIGERLLYGREISRGAEFAYYSKSQLTGAVGAVDNESEIDEVMREAGVDVIYPEKLSMVDQIGSMVAHECIIGTAGSFLHSSIFCGNRRIVCLNVTQQINTNYILIDQLAGNDASYYYPPAIRVSDQRPGFLTTRHLPEAKEVARELLKIAKEPAT